jgi:hypothetical protein
MSPVLGLQGPSLLAAVLLSKGTQVRLFFLLARRHPVEVAPSQLVLGCLEVALEALSTCRPGVVLVVLAATFYFLQEAVLVTLEAPSRSRAGWVVV